MDGLVGGPDPLASIREAVETGQFDEIMISTFSKRRSKWLRRDLPREVKRLGLPVTVVTPEKDFIASYTSESFVKGAPFLGGGPG